MDGALNLILGEVLLSSDANLSSGTSHSTQVLNSVFDGIEAAVGKKFREVNDRNALLQFLSYRRVFVLTPPAVGLVLTRPAKVHVDSVFNSSKRAIAQLIRNETWPWCSLFSDSLLVKLQELLVFLFSPSPLFEAEIERGPVP
jgi:hypothetical protein